MHERAREKIRILFFSTVKVTLSATKFVLLSSCFDRDSFHVFLKELFACVLEAMIYIEN